MTTWQAEGNIIRTDDGTQIAEASNRDTARQIVREHNAHGELVELVRKWRERITSDPTYKFGLYNLDNSKLTVFIYDLKLINAVLDRAEGRE